MRKLRGAIKETIVFGIAGGVVTASIAGAITSALLTFSVFSEIKWQLSAIESQSVEEIFMGVALASLIGLPGGLIMGVMAALTRNWAFGAGIAGMFYMFMSGASFYVFIVIFIVGVAIDIAIKNSPSNWICHLRELSKDSPLKDLSATWRISLGIGLPLFCHVAFGEIETISVLIMRDMMNRILFGLY